MTDLSEAKQNARRLWGEVGDYGSVADMIAGAGETVVGAAAVKEGERVLDVACGTGNATLPAARTGAEVVGLDLSPPLLEQGRELAEKEGLEIEWVEGDAENLPFDDGSFDVVLSVFGTMFAPDQRKTAQEVARVMKPGGRMAIGSWSPDGATGRFFALVGSHMPPPPEGFQPPVLWGTEDHVRVLFEDTGVDPNFEGATVDFVGDSVAEYMDYLSTALPPLAAAKAALEPEGKWEPLRSDVLELFGEINEADDGSVRYAGEFLLATGTKEG